MSYIRDYMTYVAVDEAHENYHLWSCLVSLAAFVGRKVWVERPYGRVYANLYVILVGLQGNRKTSAKNIAQSIMREVGGVPFACEATTREYLINVMKEQEESFTWNNRPDTFAPVCICVTEFKEFIAKDPVGIITFLTAIYDQDFYDYGTMGRGQDIITNPYLNMLACETPEWLTSRLKDSVVTGGFSRRVIYIYENDHKRFNIKTLPQEQVDARKRLILEAKRINQIVGKYELEPDAEVWYDKWYLNPEKPPDPSLQGFEESKHTLLMKIAILVSASENSSRKISLNHIQMALEMINSAERKMVRVFAGAGRNELGPVAMKVADLLERTKAPIPRKEVMSFLFHDCKDHREMTSVIEHCVRTGKAIEYSVVTPTATRFFLCSPAYLPANVQQEVARAAELTKDGDSASSPPPAPSSSQPDVVDLLRELQPDAPSSSAAVTSPPPAPVVPEHNSPQSPPST